MTRSSDHLATTRISEGAIVRVPWLEEPHLLIRFCSFFVNTCNQFFVVKNGLPQHILTNPCVSPVVKPGTPRVRVSYRQYFRSTPLNEINHSTQRPLRGPTYGSFLTSSPWHAQSPSSSPAKSQFSPLNPPGECGEQTGSSPPELQ